MPDEDDDDEFRWTPSARDRLLEQREVDAAQRSAGWRRNLAALLALILIGLLGWLYLAR